MLVSFWLVFVNGFPRRKNLLLLEKKKERGGKRREAGKRGGKGEGRRKGTRDREREGGNGVTPSLKASSIVQGSDQRQIQG